MCHLTSVSCLKATKSSSFFTLNSVKCFLFTLNFELRDIQWIITVPAIWNDAARKQMKQWAIDSGLVDSNIPNQCKIALEPEWASIAVRHEIEDALNQGDRYILVDAGGGTVDIVCHEMVDTKKVKEVLPPSGGAWGSCYIDYKFGEMMFQLFSAEWIGKFKNEHPDKWIAIIDEFQKSKEIFNAESGVQSYAVGLPVDFLYFMQDELEESGEEADDVYISDYVRQKNVFGREKLISVLKGKMHLSKSSKFFEKF